MLVDDEDMIINVGVRLFENLGYTILIAKKGKDAISLYKNNKTKYLWLFLIW